MSRMSLTGVVRGRRIRPVRTLLYGPEGIGKSTFGHDAPAAIFLAPEDGTANLDVARFQEPKEWSDVLDAVQVLTTEPHEYQTLVIDTLDWLEPLLYADLCRKNKWADIESPGYGKGYTAALDSWRILVKRLDELREARQMGVVLIAHAQIKSFKNPEGDDFDRYELKLNGKASGLLKEWCDAVLFANYETFAHTKDKRVRGISTGARFIHTERRAAFDAKNRFGLPEQMPLSWDEYQQAVTSGQTDSAENLLAKCREAMSKVDTATQAKAEAWLASNGNASSVTGLAQLLDRLKAKAEILNAPNTKGDETPPAEEAAA